MIPVYPIEMDRWQVPFYELILHGFCVTIATVIGAVPGCRQIKGIDREFFSCGEFGTQTAGFASKTFLITDEDFFMVYDIRQDT
jgi:hypothetical protein